MSLSSSKEARAKRVVKPKPGGTSEVRLRAGSNAHYRDAAYYSHTYATRTEDVAFYTEYAVARGGSVLEFGAGNGRIAMPIAEHDVSVTCVDLSTELVQDFREKLRTSHWHLADRIKVVAGDMRKVRLSKTFDTVLCTFNTALHLYTRQDVEAFLATVKRHMKPKAKFVVDLSMPQAVDLARPKDKMMFVPRFRYPGVGVVRYGERFDYDPVSQIQYVSMYFEPAEKSTSPWVTPLTHRQFFPQEWEALLHYNGFRVEEVFGDFDRSPLSKESETMRWIATKR